MKKIYLIDYIGDSLKSGEIVGHPVNVGNQFFDMLKEKYDIYCIAPQNELEFFETSKKVKLKYNALRGEKGKLQILKNYLHEYINLKTVWKTCSDGNLLLFYNTDYLFNLFLIFHSKKKSICCTYVCVLENENILSKFIKKTLLHFSAKKILIYIYSNWRFKCDGTKKIYVPDFLYRKDLFDIYKNRKKEDKIVCVGTMSEDNKELKELVNVFKKINYKLEIRGNFFNKEFYKEIISEKSDNINIIDEFLPNDKYYEVLATAKFSILPYKVNSYKHKTSGVILESIFLNAIPIAPSIILDNNNIKGIKYDNISDLENIDFWNIDVKTIYEFYREEIDKYYSFENRKYQLESVLEDA